MTYTFLSFITDAVLVLVILSGAVIGYKRGFIRTVAKPVKWIAALYIAFRLCTVVGDKWIAPMIQTPLQTQLSEYLHTACASLTAENAADELPTLIKMAAGLFNIDVSAVAADAAGNVIDSIVTALVGPVAHLLAAVVSFLGLYLVAQLLLSLVLAVLNSVCSVGLIGAANRIVGVVVTTCLSFIVAWLLVALAGFVFGFPSVNAAGWVKEVEGSVFYRFLHNNGPLDLLLRF